MPLGVLKRAFSFALALILYSNVSFGQINWDGDNPLGNFTFCNNYFADVCPLSTDWNSANDLQFNFNNGSATTAYMDFGTYKTLRSLIFLATYPSSISLDGDGNGIDLWYKIDNLSSFTQTINVPIFFQGIGSEFNPVNGDLIISSAIGNNGKDLLIYGNNSKFITFNGVVSGAGKFAIKQYSKALFNAAQTYTGNTELDNGELWLASNGSIAGGSAVYLGNGTLPALTTKIYAAEATGGKTYSNTINVNLGNSGTRFLGGLNSSGTNTFSGSIPIASGGNLTLDAVNAGGTTDFTGLISGSAALISQGAGTIKISGGSANTFTGGTTLSSGTLVLNKTAGLQALGTGALSIGNGTILRTDAANQFGTGTPPLVTITGTGNFNGNGNSQKIALSGTGTVTMGAGTLTIDNTLTDTYSGIISGSGGLTKSNVGTQILSGVNTYTGTTTVALGTLQLGAANVIANTSAVTLSGGTFSTGSGFAETAATFSMTASSVITLGAAAHSLTFTGAAGSFTGTLTVNGYVRGTTKLFMGSSKILTTTQLGQINFTGFSSGAAQLPTGEVVPAGPIVVSGSTTEDGTYSSLTNASGAFAALNAVSQAGKTISITVSGDVTETGANTLTGAAGQWSTLAINPSGVRTLSGTVVGAPLIDLNGADNVTIDGLNTGGNSLTISNLSNSSTANTSTIRFIADATSNTIQNCTLLGSATTSAAAGGTVLFSTGTATGNDANIINSNTIGAAGANLPIYAVYSAGSSTAIDNSGITISGNNIADFFNAASASIGINVASNSSAWTISSNRLYQNTPNAGSARTATVSNTHEAIKINTPSGVNYAVTGNIIGYSNSAGTGTSFYAGVSTTYIGIDLAVGTATASSIQNNTLSNFNLSTASGAQTSAGIFSGIYVSAGNVNIGTTTGNLIGNSTNTNFLFITSTTSGGYINGISSVSTGTVNISNNTIASFGTGGTAAIGYYFFGINTSGTGGVYTVNSNTIGGTIANSIGIGVSGTTTAIVGVTGIYNDATGATIIGASAAGNTVRNLTAYGSNTGSFFYGIRNNGAASSLNIDYNTFSTNTIASAGVSTSYLYSCILNGGAVTGTISLNNNIISSGTLSASPVAGAIGLIVNSATAATGTTVTISNNSMTGISLVGGTAMTGDFEAITQFGTPSTETISNNNFNALNIKSTGNITLIENTYSAPANGSKTITGNFITTSFIRNGAGALGFYGYYDLGSSPSSVSHTISGNNFSNINTGATNSGSNYIIVTLDYSASNPGLNVFNNTISGNAFGTGVSYGIDAGGFAGTLGTPNAVYSNTVSNCTSAGTFYGIYVENVGVYTDVYSNQVFTLSTSAAAGTVTGITVAGATTAQKVYKNLVYDISCTGASGASVARGIDVVSAAGTETVYNNLVGDIKAANSTQTAPTPSVVGLNISAAGGTINAYYNTINLSAAAGGTNFGSAALYANTGATVNVVNNIFVNSSVANGTGRAVAYQRSSTTLTSYAGTSNNNLWFAGTPGASRLIYYDGTNSDRTLAEFQGRLSNAGGTRDILSVTENPAFISTVGSNANFLHITAGTTYIESRGVNIAGINDDYDANIRQGNGGYVGTGTAPDIGADEFAGTFQCGPITVTSTGGTGGPSSCYLTLAAAIAAINSTTIHTGTINCSVPAGFTETAPAGGYQLTFGNVTNPITYIKSGAGTDPTITASPSLTSGALNDGIFKLIGADYTTIDRFIMQENPANLTTAVGTNNMTEWGVALLYASLTDGAQNNLIQNCTISLNRTYLNTFGIYSNTRHSATLISTTAEVTSSVGANSSNRIYTNTISNVNFGIVFIGAGTTIAAIDNGNDIGGSSAGTGNTITNWGGGAALSGYISLTLNNYCIFVNQQINDNVSYNTITSASISSSVSEGGILKNYSVASPTTGTITTTINNNTIAVSNNPSAAITGGIFAINNQGLTPLLATATTTINNNTVQNCVLGGSTSTTNGMIGITNASLPGTLNITGNSILNNSITATTATTSSISAISNSGAAGTVNINNNIVRGFTNNTNTSFSGSFTGITNSGAVVTALSMNNNQIGNASGNAFSYSLGATAAINNGIQNTAGAATCALNIDGNSFVGFTMVSASSVTGILNTIGFVGANISMSNNALGTAAGGFLSFSAATSAGVTGIANQGGSATSALTITGNDFRGIVHSLAGSSAHTYISNTFATLSQNISTNTFTNLIVNTTGNVTFISNSVTLSGSGTKTINSNLVVTGFSKTGAGNNVYFYIDNGSTVSTFATINNNSNNFSNITVTGLTIIQGWLNTDGASGVTKNIQNNTFSTLTGGTSAVFPMQITNGTGSISGNTITSASAQNTVTGMSVTAGTFNIFSNIINNLSSATPGSFAGVTGINISGGTTQSVYQNTINTLSTTATSSAVSGIIVSGGTTVNVYKNKIYDLLNNSASFASVGVSGITISGGTTVTAYNNYVGDLRVTTVGIADAIRGINISAGSGTINLYYNTVYLNASSAGSGFGTSAIYANTGPTVNLRNNIFVNLSTASGAGRTIAYWRNGATLSSYANTSNNNLFYAGTPSAANVIYFDGTNSDRTLAEFQGRLSNAGGTRDIYSVTENPTFLNTATPSLATWLHINPAVPTYIESRGVNIAGITDDYDTPTETRQGNIGYVGTGTAPDIGADEFAGIYQCGPITVTSAGGSGAPSSCYLTLAGAVAAINSGTIHTGTTTCSVPFGFTETAPAGGYQLTASGSSGNLITYIKSGAGTNPTITASPSLTSGALNDGIFKLIGADYTTIDGFTMQENGANLTTAAATNNMTEWGVAFLYATTTNGAQNNLIQNCTISLNRNYSNTFGIYSNTRHSATAVTTGVDIINNTTAPNSNNKIYSNNISNVNMGITFIGSGTAANMDVSNDIGGSSIATANTLSGFGTLSAASGYISNSGTNYGIYVNHQTAYNVSYNTLTSNTGIAATTLNGIRADYSTTAPTGTFTNTISNNTITLDGAGTTTFRCIDAANNLNTITLGITNNTLLNNNITGLTTSFSGILTSGTLATLNITGNIIRGTASSATSGGFTGISNTATVSTAINLNNNQIGNASGNAVTFSASTSGTITGITNSAGASTCALNITGNSFVGLNIVAAASVTGITNTVGFVGANININNNLLGTTAGGFLSFSAATSAGITGISNAGGSATSVLTMTGNDIRGIVHSVQGSSVHTYISNTFATLSQNISTNTFTNLNVNTTGNVTFISNSVTAPATGSKTVNTNSIVTAFNKGGAGGTLALYSDGAVSICTTPVQNQNNNFSNITVTGATIINGWSNADGTGSTPQKTITGNTFSNWTCGTGAVTVLQSSFGGTSSISSNTITGITGQGAITALSQLNAGTITTLTIASNIITGITSTGTGGAVIGISNNMAATTTNINANTINTLSSTGAVATVAISNTLGAAVNIFKNKIYDISGSNASSTVNGILVSSGTTVSVYNNLVGDLRTSTANAANPLIGINITGGTTINLYYNTVLLAGSSSGALFGSSAVSVATAPTVNFINNIFVNNSSIAGAGLAVAYRRSTTTLTSYAGTSNNNDFFATSAIYTDGTNTDITLAAYKTRVSTRDAAAVTENPVFLSTSGASANFLHIDNSANLFLESGGIPVSGITDDYDADTRSGTKPDIGADEFIPPANDAGITALANSPFPFCAGSQSITVTLKNYGSSNLTSVKIDWTVNGAAQAQNSWTGNLTYGSTTNVTLTLPFTFAAGTNYIVTATTSLPNGLTDGNSANNTFTSATFQTILSGNINVGAGQTYTTLTAAVAAANTLGLCGPTTFSLIDANYSTSETFPIVINVLTGSSSTNTLTIKPASGVNATITGSVNNGALIKLNGADNIIFDGSNNGTTTKNLTITNSSATTPTTIWVGSTGTGSGATGNTIKNCIINTGSKAATSYGIFAGDATTIGTAGNDNDNLTIQNNTISFAYFGIYAAALTTGRNDNLTISNNSIGNNTLANSIGNTGIYIDFANIVSASGNDIFNISSGAATTDAVNINNITTGSFFNNKVRDIVNTSGSLSTGRAAGFGINVNALATSSGLSFYNNFIAGIINTGPSGTLGFGCYGFYLKASSGSDFKLYYNSVNLFGTRNSAVAANVSAACFIGASLTVVDIRDNIFVNSQTSTTGASSFSIYSNSANTAFTAIDYNDYFVSGAQGVLGFLTSNRTNLAGIIAGFGSNANSINVAPVFTSATDLHLDVTSNLGLDNLGTPITGITTDIDAATRNTVTPDMGADEFNSCSGSLFTWLGSTDNDWNKGSNWCSGITIPTPTVDVIIPAGLTNYPSVFQTADATVKSITIANGASLSVSGAYNITVASGGSFTNNGIFTTSSSGAVIFAGTGSVAGSSTTAFKNLTINGDLTLTKAPTISGDFTINSGAVGTNSPTYGSSSKLIYNVTGSYTTATEWNAGGSGTLTTPGAGVPKDVTIQGGTVIIPDASGANRALAGILTIGSGTTLQMTSGTRDLYVGGNWVNNGGTFTANSRTVTMSNSSADQSFTGNTTFYNLTLGNVSNTVDFGSSTITIDNTFSNSSGTMAGGTSTFIFTGATGSIIGGNAKNFYNLQVTSPAVISHTTGGGLIRVDNDFKNNGSFTELSTYTFYFDKSGTSPTITGNGTTTFGNLTIGSSFSAATALNAGSSNFTIGGTAITFNSNNSTITSTGTITFGASSPGTCNISNASVTGTSISFNNVNISPVSVLESVNFGSGISSINGTLTINSGGSVVSNAPTYNTGSLLKYNTGAVYNRSIEWSTTSGAGYPYNVQVSNNSTLIPGGTSNTGTALNTANNLTIDAGASLLMDNGTNDMTVPLTVNKDITINGNLNASDNAGGTIIVKGNWVNNTGAVFTPKTRSVTFNGTGTQSIGGTQSTTFDDLIVSNASNPVTQNADVTVAQLLNLNNILSLNGRILNLNGTITGSGTLTGSNTSTLNLGGTGNSMGTLNFTTGSQSLNTISINRTGGTFSDPSRVILGSSLAANNITLTNGIIVTGTNNLFTFNNSGGTLTQPVIYTNSFIATCDASGTPLAVPGPMGLPFTGAYGFRIKTVGNSNTFFPVGPTYLPAGSGLTPSPNRMMINNAVAGGTPDFTVVVNKGDITGTAGSRINRIWYVKSSSDTGQVDMRLYFTERNPATFGSSQDEVESGYDYSDIRLVQRDYSSDPNFISVSSGNDILNGLPFVNGTETFAQYTAGATNSIDNLGRTIGLTEFNRFSIANNGNIILPVTITNLRAALQNTSVAVSWTSVSETNIDHYEIERSNNGISFNSIGSKAALNNGSIRTDYGFLDIHPQSGDNYYRIKVVEKDGRISYTNVVLITTTGGSIQITIQPNPVKNGNALVRFTNAPEGKYNLILYSNSGQKVWQKSVGHLGGSADYSIKLPVSIAKGIYFMHVENEAVQVVKKLMVE